MGGNHRGPLKLLQQFRGAQERRAMAYSRLQEGFLRYLHERDGAEYRQLVAAVTSEFQACSSEVRRLEVLLADCERSDLAAQLRSVQNLERTKLELTLDLQSLRQAGAQGSEEEGVTGAEQCTESKIINEINDVLEELRYEEHDLQSSDYSVDTHEIIVSTTHDLQDKLRMAS